MVDIITFLLVLAIILFYINQITMIRAIKKTNELLDDIHHATYRLLEETKNKK
jgi:hypothetical protein